MALPTSNFLAACGGQRPDRTPVWIMRQAGRYLPEYRAIRRRVSFEDLCRSPDLCAEVTLQPVERFGVDAAILFSDILVVLDALGVEVRFNPGPSIDRPVRTHNDLRRLERRDVAQSLGFVFDAVRACKVALGGRVPLIGFCGAPFTTASYLIEGGSSADFRWTKGLMWSHPVAFGHLMETLTDILCEYLSGQVEAGADALQIFESWAGALAPEDYRTYVRPHVSRLVAHASGLGVPVIMFARGNAELLAQVATFVPEGSVIGVDWTIDLDRAVDVVGTDKVVQGNLDPMVLLAGDADVLRERALRVVEHGRKARAHVFNLGHGISKDTDPAMVQLLVDVVHGA